MAEKSLAEMTAKAFDTDAKIVKFSGIVATVGVIVAVGFVVSDLIEAATETQVSFTLILVAFLFVAVFGNAMALANMQLRLRRDLWDVMHEISKSD
jgi:hypothetical protein